MTDRNCCLGCCKFVFSCGIASLSFWLLLYTSTPLCSIEEFDALALEKTANSTIRTNRTLHYDLKLKNRIANKGIYYDALNLTFYYKPNLSHYLIGNATYPAFYQGHHKSAHRVGSFDAATEVVSENATAVFRVELATAVRYKHILWKSKRHRLVVAAEVQVNDRGSLVKLKGNKGIKMSSGAAKIEDCFNVVGILGILAFVHVL